MAEVFAGTLAEFQEHGRLIVKQPDYEIGVFLRDGSFYAYRNECFHQGGPACEGMMIAKVEDVIEPDRTVVMQRFSDTEMHFVCPWHGYEYDLRTGEFVADRRKKLQKFNVVQKGDSVYVVV
jgi:nitrite reductase/ring-hydroxylating ferredoxin subunit